jgi:glucose/arabinose dehydrogenase
MIHKLLAALSPLTLLAASCGAHAAGDSAALAEQGLAVAPLATFDEPWAMAVLPNGGVLVTEKAGKLKLRRSDGRIQEIALPVPVDYGGQGGLGDIVLGPNFASDGRIFLSWAASGPNNTRGAKVGRGTLVLSSESPRIVDFRPFWQQVPMVAGRGHYSHRLTFSPDGKYLFIASGDRQKMQPAQDMASNLGKIVRIEVNGEAVPRDNPFAAQGGVAATIWSSGHRNILGLKFDASGRLWDLEHGPAGGDELNLVKQGANYGWPVVSQGDHYNGTRIPRHASRPEFAAPAISWNPVIAPGDMIFYSGKLWADWQGQAIIAGMDPGGLVRVAITGESASEVARHDMGKRIRSVAEAADGSLLLLEDGSGGRLLRVSKAK